MTDESVSSNRCEGELRFWRWWRDGVVAAGVLAVDLPTLSFREDLLVDDVSAPGVFQVHLDEALGRLEMSIKICSDLCSRMTLDRAALGFPSEFLVLPQTPPWLGRTTDGVLMLALQCAYYEQSAWSMWRVREGRDAANQAGVKRARWLVRRWLSAPNPRYRRPGHARGIEPIRFSARRWIISGEWIVPESR